MLLFLFACTEHALIPLVDRTPNPSPEVENHEAIPSPDVPFQLGDLPPGVLPPATGEPEIYVDPPMVDFGRVDVGSPQSSLVTIANRGTRDLQIQGLDVLYDDVELLSPFGFSSTVPRLAPGEYAELLLTWTPESYGDLRDDLQIFSDDPERPLVGVPIVGETTTPVARIEPELYGFGPLEIGSSAHVDVTVHNDGDAPLSLQGLTYDSREGDLYLLDGSGLEVDEIEPGGSARASVGFEPSEVRTDRSTLEVHTDDPIRPTLSAIQVGRGVAPPPFSAGWYIVNDRSLYETTSNPDRPVRYSGDVNGYWYEPSGVHGLLDSPDPDRDFAFLREYVLDRAGAPTPVDGPLDFRSGSDVPTHRFASYSYIACDFWLPANDDPSRYQVRVGQVDDGVRVLVNGVLLGDVKIGEPGGRWSLEDVAVAGELNTLIVVLMDNNRARRLLQGLAFLRDGEFVTSE